MRGARTPSGAPRGGLAGLCAALVLLLAACSSGPSRQNLILITVDTLRADHTSLFGYARDTTPRLAEWAREGTLFTRATAASSWTLPSMSMLLTGQVQVKNQGRVFPTQQSLAQLLRGRGYATGAVVANQLLTPDRGFDAGFDAYQLFEPGAGRAPGQPAARVNGWLADEVTRRGIEWAESAGAEPFFLALHYFDPHDPYLPADGLAFEPFHSAERRERFRSALRPEHASLFDEEVYRGIEQRIAQYDSEVLQTDRGLGELLDWLERTGRGDDTLVCLTADHGEGLWQRAALLGEELKPVFFPQLYFEHGIMLHSEQVHVPLVFVGPGVPAGVRDGRPATLLDVVPTVLDLLDVAVPDRVLHGVSLFSDSERAAERPIFSICSRGTTVTVDGRWRLHQPRAYRVERDGVGPELYDLERDPLELEPVDDAERTAELQELIERWTAFHEDFDVGEAAPLDLEAERARLEALGYVWEEMFGEEGTGPR